MTFWWPLARRWSLYSVWMNYDVRRLPAQLRHGGHHARFYCSLLERSLAAAAASHKNDADNIHDGWAGWLSFYGGRADTVRLPLMTSNLSEFYDSRVRVMRGQGHSARSHLQSSAVSRLTWLLPVSRSIETYCSFIHFQNHSVVTHLIRKFKFKTKTVNNTHTLKHTNNFVLIYAYGREQLILANRNTILTYNLLLPPSCLAVLVLM